MGLDSDEDGGDDDRNPCFDQLLLSNTYPKTYPNTYPKTYPKTYPNTYLNTYPNTCACTYRP